MKFLSVLTLVVQPTGVKILLIVMGVALFFVLPFLKQLIYAPPYK